MNQATAYTIEPRGDEFVLISSADEIIGRFANAEAARQRAWADSEGHEEFQTKTEDGVSFPPAAYAYVPDREVSSTWKLRLWQTLALKETPSQVGAAVAAIGPGGFRGRRVQIPVEDRPAVLQRIRVAWLKANSEKTRDDLPPILKRDTFDEHEDPDDKLFELKGVEIFRTGKWKGRLFTTSDLDNMVTTFGIGAGKAGFRPPVKLGHFNKSGDPAFGWVGSIHRKDKRLIADLVDLPAEVHKAIRLRRFDAVSAEIGFDMEVNNKTLPVVLLGIALLGSDIPAVAGLKPLRKVAADLDEVVCSEINIYNLRNTEDDPMDNAEILKKHPDAIKKLEADLVQATEDGDDDRKKALAQKLIVARGEFAEAENEKLRADLAKAEKDKVAAEAKGGGEAAVQLTQMQARLDENDKQIAVLKTKNREAEIDAKLDKINIPALRPTMKGLYDAAYAMSDAGKKVHFSYTEGEGDDKKTIDGDVDPVKVADLHMAALQRGTKKLFDELGFAGDFGPKVEEEGDEEDVGKTVQAKVEAYMEKNEKADYQTALHAVLSGDPVLKANYAKT